MERFRGRPAQRPRHCSVPAESPPGVLASWRSAGSAPAVTSQARRAGAAQTNHPGGPAGGRAACAGGPRARLCLPPARASRTATSSLQSGPGQQCLLARGVALCRTARSAVQRPRAVATCTTRWGPGSAVRRLGLGHCAKWPESISRCPGHPAGAWSSTQLSHRMSKHRFPRAAGQRKPGR